MGSTGGPELRWLERGEGEPVVLLHGLMGHMHHWQEVLDGLGDGVRAVAPTLPLFDPALREVSIAGLVAFVGRLLDALDASQVVLGGNSLGGHVALASALAFPDRVSGLVLAGSSGLFERSFNRGVPHRPTAGYVREKMEEVVHDPRLVTPEWVAAVQRTVTERATARRILGFARAARRDNVDERLPEVAVPTLVLWGAADRITPPEVAVRFHSRIPDSKLVFLAGCGHAPMMEQPAAFAATLRGWLEDTRLRRWPPAATREERQ